MSERLSRSLDIARWVSALLVILDHLNSRMFEAYKLIPAESRPKGLLLWEFLCGFGAPAVTVFFVLSGYLVGGKLVAEVKKRGTIDLRKYAIDRVVRIYLVLLPVILLVWILDRTGSGMFASTHVYQQYDPPLNLGINLSKTALFGTFANLQDIFFPYWGTDGPLGTLAWEFWYYITFPALLAVVMWGIGKAPRLVIFGCGIACVTVMSIYSPFFGFGFLVWACGVAASLAPKRVFRSSLGAICLFMAVTIGIRIGVRQPIMGDAFRGAPFNLITGLLFANCIVCWRFDAAKASPLLASRIHVKLAGFSYSLYAYHATFITFLCAWEMAHFKFGWHGVPNKAWHWGLLALNFALTIAGARALAWVTESHTKTVREFFYRIFKVRIAPRLAPADALVQTAPEAV